MTTVVREDLSRRTALSKSALQAFDLCATKHWYGIHEPRPFVTNEKVTFGSAVDAAVEVIVKLAASGQPVDLTRALDAAAFVIVRDGVDVDNGQVAVAIETFVSDVLPAHDWSRAVTQASITTVIDGLGESNGHPDLIMGDGSILDVKTSSRSKDVPSVELGFYALLAEADGRTVPTVGYLNYVRLKTPYWHGYTRNPKTGETMGERLVVPVDDELRRWAYENAAAYVRARKADAVLNGKATKAGNYSMTGGPKFDGLCADCPYNPALGGPCAIVRREQAA
jgi:hypothetical protein